MCQKGACAEGRVAVPTGRMCKACQWLGLNYLPVLGPSGQVRVGNRSRRRQAHRAFCRVGPTPRNAGKPGGGRPATAGPLGATLSGLSVASNPASRRRAWAHGRVHGPMEDSHDPRSWSRVACVVSGGDSRLDAAQWLSAWPSESTCCVCATCTRVVALWLGGCSASGGRLELEEGPSVLFPIGGVSW
jgi:hypothetical protein